ncbi:MAG: hypothetical protein F2873_06020 [Actinobacteria bacterium]|uniref:Unannotated protein n=1 Tax=freshwater metagenome TaxID=449393 RepID=A0A6J7NFL8_9ZZZZ|nr:hypothetical protein [Actinomycetota bacterium]MSX79527.1 hypothetical protein [Actinomycetota bacterium]
MKKFALGLIAAATATAGAFAFAPSANAAAPETTRIGCYIPAPGQFVSVSVVIEAIGNTNPTPGVPMVWNCLQ